LADRPDRRVGEWLEALASSSPTPGGGAAAGVAAAMGAALIAMVGNLTVGKEDFAAVEDRMRSLIDTAEAERAAFLELADRDAEAFQAVMASFQLPKDTDEAKASRTLRIQEAYEGAAGVPLELARRAADLMELAEVATTAGNPHASSDGYSAGALLFAAARCAIANVRINAAGLKDEATARSLVDECDAIASRSDELLAQIEEAFQLRIAG
jgi:formiminotetrahydrofolate cyclodeaminase